MNPISIVGPVVPTFQTAPRAAARPAEAELPQESFVSSGRIAAEAPRAAAPATVREAVAPAAPAPCRATVPVSLVDIPAEAPAPLGKVYPGYDRANLDPTVRPQDDFYHYAMGGYIKSHPIPPDKQSWGIRSELYERVDGILKDICETTAANRAAAKGSVDQKVGDFYASALDTAQMDAAGLQPLQPVLDRIAAIQTPDDVQDAIADLHAQGFGGMFAFGAGQDAKNPETVIAEADQGGLTLPGRDFYLSDKPDKAEIRTAYLDHVTKMFGLMGDDPATARANAETVMSVETELAKGCLTRAERRDPARLYHIMDRSQLAELTPHLSWDRYLDKMGLDGTATMNVSVPDFFKTLDAQLANRPASDWKTYLRWQVLNQNASFVSQPFRDQNFAFKSGVLSGVTQQPERWKVATSLTDSYLGEAVGQKFVERAFPPEAKERARDMVMNIVGVMRDKIAHLGWMSDESKKEALAKIDRLNVKIGYPDQWTDYSALEIDRGPLVSNILRARAFGRAEDLATIGKPVDRGQWHMTPATVNAYYSPTLNEIVFPAARLLPPFFDPNQDDATNYGATGATIAHELTHGFDDSGSQFDSRGVLRDWWTPDDKIRFRQIADGVIGQMSEFEYDGQKQDGKLVAGESMADLGGIEIAYEALQRSLQGKPDPITADGFTPQQRFFLSYTICRESNETPKAAHMQMSTDPHPLGQFRVNGPLANMPAFHQAFGCQPGDAMVRAADKRNTLWNA